MKKLAPAALTLALLIWAGTWHASSLANTAQQRNALLTGNENSQRTNRLTSEINWHTSLAHAQNEARLQEKMILWVNILGTLSGGT